MVEQFRSAGVDFEILPATDWRDLGAKERAMVDRRERCREGRRLLTDGMIACWLSHRRAFEIIIEGGDRMAAVFEDDVVLGPDTKTVLTRIEDSDFDFDIIFLHRNKYRWQNKFLSVASLNHRYSLGLLRSGDWGTQAYVITKRAVKKLLYFYPRIVHQIDHSLHAYWLHELGSYYLDPPVIFQNKENTHSFLQDAPLMSTSRSPTIVMRRIVSIVSEELRKRLMFRRRVMLLRDSY